MNDIVQNIPVARLALAFLPAFAVVFVVGRWGLGYGTSIHAIIRMLLQLAVIGYFLGFVFESGRAWIVLAVLAVMLGASSWIALRTVPVPDARLIFKSLGSIGLAGGATLVLVTQGVLHLEPWYLPSYMIPLAGMIFASAMNSVSLAAERLSAELERGEPYATARGTALRASLIPITNSLFAVGLVSIPGMMTGQILSGVSPLVAARYQVMVMCMIFGAAGIAAALFLNAVRSDLDPASR